MAVASPSRFGLVQRITSVMPLLLHPDQELADPELVGPDPLDGVEGPLQHVVPAVELARPLH